MKGSIRRRSKDSWELTIDLGRDVLWTPQKSSGTSKEFLDAEGFGNVIVSAQIQTPDDIFFLALGGQHDDGNIQPVGANRPANLVTVQFGQHDVKEDQIRATVERSGETGFTVAGSPNVISLGLKVVS